MDEYIFIICVDCDEVIGTYLQKEIEKLERVLCKGCSIKRKRVGVIFKLLK